MARPYEKAWRIGNYTDSILVQCGTTEHPYWWVLCPAAATLYFEEHELIDCSLGIECDWDHVYEAAERLRKKLLADGSGHG